MDREEISFTVLDKGLGFYADSPDGSISNKTDKKEPKPPTDLLSQLSLDFSLDLEDPVYYKNLVAALEQPYLGNIAETELMDSQFPKTSIAPASSFVKKEADSKPPIETTTFTEEVSPIKTNGGITSINKRPENTQANRQTSTPENTQASIQTNTQTSVQENRQTSTPYNQLQKNSEKILENSMQKSSEKILLTKQAEVAPTPSPAKKSGVSVLACAVDTCLIALLFFPSLSLFLFLTQANPIAVALNVWPQITVAFLLFSQIYCLLFRLFCYETCGETVAQIRLSQKNKKEVHPYLLFWRFLVSCLTGVVVFPFFQLICRRDLMSIFTRLSFQKI